MDVLGVLEIVPVSDDINELEGLFKDPEVIELDGLTVVSNPIEDGDVEDNVIVEIDGLVVATEPDAIKELEEVTDPVTLDDIDGVFTTPGFDIDEDDQGSEETGDSDTEEDITGLSGDSDIDEDDEGLVKVGDSNIGEDVDDLSGDSNMDEAVELMVFDSGVGMIISTRIEGIFVLETDALNNVDSTNMDGFVNWVLEHVVDASVVFVVVVVVVVMSFLHSSALSQQLRGP